MRKDLTKSLSTHLEFLGYEVTRNPDGWTTAVHPTRYNFAFQLFDIGVRLHSSVALGRTLANADAWQAYLNRANDTSTLTRYALVKDADGDIVVRARALLPPQYERRLFGMLLDAWQEDLVLLRHAPPPEAEEDVAEDGEGEEEGRPMVN